MDDLTTLVQAILSSRKYRDAGIPEETVRDLLEKELSAGHSQKEALKIAKQKMHNIVAPYLGDPDYEQANEMLETASRQGRGALEAACKSLLAAHTSTRERLPLLEEFYPRLFAITGTPRVVLDLACGLNPLALPWMELPGNVCYHAYDILAARIRLINHFFELQGLPQLAEVRDILVTPPQAEADVAFFFKEAHRFEQRQHGANRAFFKALRVRWLLVSLPATSLSGRHNLAEGQRRLVYNAIQGMDWQVEEMRIGDEMVFVIEKEHGPKA